MGSNWAVTAITAYVLVPIALLQPDPGAAQTTGQDAATDPRDAERLYRKAKQVEAADARSMQLTAAWLYREAARLWPKAHEKRYRSLWRAAHMYLHHGRTRKASALFAEAARQARRNERPTRAATCYLRLARLSAELGREDRARTVLDEARVLLSGNALERAERDRLETMKEMVRVMIAEVEKGSS